VSWDGGNLQHLHGRAITSLCCWLWQMLQVAYHPTPSCQVPAGQWTQGPACSMAGDAPCHAVRAQSGRVGWSGGSCSQVRTMHETIVCAGGWRECSPIVEGVGGMASSAVCDWVCCRACRGYTSRCQGMVPNCSICCGQFCGIMQLALSDTANGQHPLSLLGSGQGPACSISGAMLAGAPEHHPGHLQVGCSGRIAAVRGPQGMPAALVRQVRQAWCDFTYGRRVVAATWRV
jgi:hypothetical protein